MDAILAHGHLSDLEAPINKGLTKDLLRNPEDWRPNQNVSKLTEALKARNITLDENLARALCSFGQAMALDTTELGPQHILEFVQVRYMRLQTLYI